MKKSFFEIEQKWNQKWTNEKTYKFDLNNFEKKLYCLVMFLYPSASKLHIGHWFNYAPTDSWARYKRMKGYNVFEPIGYDAFGLPAENYAIKTQVHPNDSTSQNVNEIREQLKSIGAMYDFDFEVNTSQPNYYKWTQWIFLQFFKNGLAYRTNAPVNWCPKDQTVLANEQVVDGKCERCGTDIVRENRTQWFFKITKYADELLEKLDEIDWPEKTKTMQRNWIGKSSGIEIEFQIENSEKKFKVFTTRSDTLFGVTYVVLAPECELVLELAKEETKSKILNYIEQTKKESEIERLSTEKEKTGIFTGSFAIHPFTNKKIPIWISDYVLVSYGTGAVMGVPAHDERDFEFAKKYSLPIQKVILENGKSKDEVLQSAFIETGIIINSNQFDGLNSEIAKEKICDELEKTSKGKRKINYRLHDWLISRQRYWGAPIPIIHCKSCGIVPVPEHELPILLPYEVDFRPTGESPLARSEKFVNTKCPNCNQPALRDVDTMDTFVDSSWYFLRYVSPNENEFPFDKNLVKKFLPVDKYIGGAEHSVMHLLYARFVTKALRDLGYIAFDEPFSSLIHQGTITNKGAKMSKSKGNVVIPDDFILKYGSDVFRLFLMFMRPYNESGDWSDEGILGTFRFANKIYNLVFDNKDLIQNSKFKNVYEVNNLTDETKKLYRKINQTIKKVDENIEHFHFNVAIASLMELINEITKFETKDDISKEIFCFSIYHFIILLSPLAPHLSEEMWELIGEKESLFVNSKWKSFDTNAISEDSVTIAIQINGKLRTTILFSIDTDENKIKEIAFENEIVKKYVDGKTIVKTIVVKNKLINFVVK